MYIHVCVHIYIYVCVSTCEIVSCFTNPHFTFLLLQSQIPRAKIGNPKQKGNQYFMFLHLPPHINIFSYKSNTIFLFLHFTCNKSYNLLYITCTTTTWCKSNSHIFSIPYSHSPYYIHIYISTLIYVLPITHHFISTKCINYTHKLTFKHPSTSTSFSNKQLCCFKFKLHIYVYEKTKSNQQNHPTTLLLK